MGWLASTGRLSRPDVGARGAEGPGAGLSRGVFEDIHGPDKLHVLEAGGANDVQVLCFQQSAPNSGSPQVYVGPGRLGHLLVGDDIGQEQPASRLQGAVHLPEHLPLVRAEVDHAVAYDHVG